MERISDSVLERLTRVHKSIEIPAEGAFYHPDGYVTFVNVATLASELLQVRQEIATLKEQLAEAQKANWEVIRQNFALTKELERYLPLPVPPSEGGEG